jgi:hypothetical protein
MPIVKLLAAHFDSDRRYVPEGTIVTVATKDLNVWQVPQDAATKTEMDKRFKLHAPSGEYKRGTL